MSEMPQAAGMPEPSRELPKELSIIQGEFNSLEGTVKELLGRLHPILPDSPHEVSDKVMGDDKPAQTPYGRQLRELSYSIAQLRVATASVLHRLEV